MMKPINKLVQLAIATSLVAFATAGTANAQTALNNRTVLTFDKSVEVPGKVLPAGTYTFEMHDSGANRHVIQIMDKAGTKLITTVLAVPTYRAQATEETVIRFAEVMPGQPQAIRQWYYPGQTTGNELVYSKTRARELAAASHMPVAAADDVVYTKMDTMKTAPVVSMTPENKEEPFVYQPAPATSSMSPAPTPAAAPRKALPRTASTLPMLVLVGGSLLALGIALRKMNAATAKS